MFFKILFALPFIQASDITKQPLTLTDIHVLNPEWVHVNGLGPCTEKLEISAPELSETFPASIHVSLDKGLGGVQLKHSDNAFVGIFRPSQYSVDIIHPTISTFYSVEPGLPIRWTFQGQLSVKPNDIIFALIPFKSSWAGINAGDLPFAMFEAGAAPGFKNLDNLLRNLPRLLKDSNCSLFIAMVSDKSRRQCQPYKIMDVCVQRDPVFEPSNTPVQSKVTITESDTTERKYSLSPKPSPRSDPLAPFTKPEVTSSGSFTFSHSDYSSIRDKSSSLYVDPDEWKAYLPGGPNYDPRFKTPSCNWEIGQSYGGY